MNFPLIADPAGDLFGTTLYGGTNKDGTVFELVNNGAWTLQTLVSFIGANGENPEGGLIRDAVGDLFGTTYTGGANGYGTVFEIPKAANGYGTLITLVSFTNTGGEGGYPKAGLIADAAGNLFGTTTAGGANGYGTVFELVKKGGGSYTLTMLVSFNGDNGSNPAAGLIMDAAGDLFSTTYSGGANGFNDGTVFELVKNGGSYRLNTLINFNGTTATVQSARRPA